MHLPTKNHNNYTYGLTIRSVCTTYIIRRIYHVIEDMKNRIYVKDIQKPIQYSVTILILQF